MDSEPICRGNAHVLSSSPYPGLFPNLRSFARLFIASPANKGRFFGWVFGGVAGGELTRTAGLLIRKVSYAAGKAKRFPPGSLRSDSWLRFLRMRHQMTSQSKK